MNLRKFKLKQTGVHYLLCVYKLIIFIFNLYDKEL